jgi:hypothetical protein
MNRIMPSGIMLLTLVLLVLTSAAGCGGSGAIEWSGLVTLDGEPIANGTIEFRAVDGNGPTAGGLITEGRYSLQLQPGSKVVEIHGYRQVGEERDRMFGNSNGPMNPINKEIVPARYHTPSTLSADVTQESRDDADFHLSTKPD